MSLDGLFRQVLLTEQQLTGHIRELGEVKVAITGCKEKIKSATAKYEEAAEELDAKAQQLSVMRLRRGLTKKCEDQMLKKIEELLCQNSSLRERLAGIKRESREDEERFRREISRFNSDFDLWGRRGAAFGSPTRTEILDLEREVESLYEEMELMKHRNAHMSSMQEEKGVLQLELQGLGNYRKDLDQRLSEAEAMTETLRAESQTASQKPLIDSTCLRLRKELEMHKNCELELLREALSAEIQFLQSKLDSSQGGERR